MSIMERFNCAMGNHKNEWSGVEKMSRGSHGQHYRCRRCGYHSYTRSWRER